MEGPGSPRPGAAFGDVLKRHLGAWAVAQGLGDRLEPGAQRSWVLREEARSANLYRPAWWRYIPEDRRHRWARALNSSQCFAVNLFAPLADDPGAANRFLRRFHPSRSVAETDRVQVAFEDSPAGVAERLGERGQPTQIDVVFSVYCAGRRIGAVGIEVKLSEREFGGCRGWTGEIAGVPIDPGRDRCLDGRAVFEQPARRCFMSEHEGRSYWSWMAGPGSSFVADRLALPQPCPFRHGLYQMMRNRVALDVLRSIDGAEWCDFVVCAHAGNHEVRRLPEAVGGEVRAVEAFGSLVRPGGILAWDPGAVADAIRDAEGADDAWHAWLRGKYLLCEDAVPMTLAVAKR